MVTYRFETLSDLANYFALKAIYLREQAAFRKPQRANELRAEASAYEQVVSMLRQTTITLDKLPEHVYLSRDNILGEP